MRQISNRKITLPLGEGLRERRLFLEITLDEISRKSGIATKYIRWIERGNWENLPGDIYTKGMLRRYSLIIGENPEKIVRRYEKEYEKEIKKQEVSSNYDQPKISLSPKNTRFIIGAVVVVAIFGYIIWQLSPVLAKPELTVFEPTEEEVVIQQDNIVLIGKTESGVSLYLNDQPIPISNDGGFEETIELLPGLNILEVKAISRFGKQSIVERKVIYQE